MNRELFTFSAKDNFRPHKRGAIVLLDTSGKPKALPRLPLLPRKGLKRKSRSVFEELERKARPRAAGMRPNDENTKQTPAFSRVCKPLFSNLKAEAETRWRVR
jgi:hypothetical protein